MSPSWSPLVDRASPAGGGGGRLPRHGVGLDHPGARVDAGAAVLPGEDAGDPVDDRAGLLADAGGGHRVEEDLPGADVLEDAHRVLVGDVDGRLRVDGLVLQVGFVGPGASEVGVEAAGDAG